MITENNKRKMTAHVTAIQWENQPQYPTTPTYVDLKNSSFLHSQKLKASLLESRKQFLSLDTNDALPPPKKPSAASKKASFKVKKSSRRTTPSSTMVSELTQKFNVLINEKNLVLEQPTLRKLMKRVNSQREETRKMSAVARKPSVKTKPVLSDKDLLAIRRRTLKKTSDSTSAKSATRAKNEPEPTHQRPTTLAIAPQRPPKPSGGTVKATIQIFERRSNSPGLRPPKPALTDFDSVEIVEMPAVLPQRRCESMYETENCLRRVSLQTSQSVDAIKPNTSFLWSINQDKSPSSLNSDDWRSLYDFVDPKPVLPPKNQPQEKPPTLPPKNGKLDEEKIYEELNRAEIDHNYEYCDTGQSGGGRGEAVDDDYEYCASPKEENIYETLPSQPPVLPKRQQLEPLPVPPRPPSRSSYCTIQNGTESNCYESIDEKENESNYESIYGGGSVVSSEQKSNSIYGRASFGGWSDDGGTLIYGKGTSDLSSSDRSDNWVDITDNEDNEDNLVVIRDKNKMEKLQQNQGNGLHTISGMDSDSDNHYECLSVPEKPPEDDYDSFDSDTDGSFSKVNLNDSGVDIANTQLPELPNQTYGLAEKLRKFQRNLTLPKHITKSLSRMRKRKSRPDIEPIEATAKPSRDSEVPSSPKSYQSAEYAETKSLGRKSLLYKFRRSMSLSADLASEVTSNLEHKPKSTFYLTGDIDIDSNVGDSSGSAQAQKKIVRPQSPPPPVPRKEKRSTSWYAEVGLFKNADIMTDKSNTCWYAEVGLYPAAGSTPSTSSAENSGTNTTSITLKNDDFINQDNSEEYYNMMNGADYYNNSISSTETKKDKSLTPDIQLRLQNEPLYQFYDEAILDTVCHDGTDFDSDSYEDVGEKTTRPSAMEIVAPKRNSIAFSRTLWCEIPEVIQSCVLSTLSTHQKKLQEAKFEMVTSEASYLNSLNVLTDHFMAGLKDFDLSADEMEVMFGKVGAVKNCSEKLLHDLEKCWQENILLNGVCDIVQKHAEENFHVYIEYCENQILLEDTLKRIKEKAGFVEFLRQLESSADCQSLALYSFLLLPLQRVTRWPLLVDAVLKRLSSQDTEYLTCQYALATINKIVSQCNEGARRKERENEMKKIAYQLELGKGVPPIDVITENRWLIRSGSVVHMQPRADEIKLTFGKRFSKTTLYLFLFNDLLFITKPKSDNLYTVIHYCARNLVELNSTDVLVALPAKDSQGRNLIFLTLLENQNQKTVEFLISCNCESDKERWMEALLPPVSENPNETIYGCWDCPQVTAIHNYFAGQPDELALSRGDTINVLRKMADGWYHGERIRDGQTGWFPANYTAEIANQHVRSRNLKQRYRLLTFSENYLKNK